MVLSQEVMVLSQEVRAAWMERPQDLAEGPVWVVGEFAWVEGYQKLGVTQ